MGQAGYKPSFIGSSRGLMKAGVFTLGRWTASSHDTVEPHGHHDAHFIWILSGAFASVTDQETLSAGALIFNPAQTFHADHFIGGRGAFLSLTLNNVEGFELEQFQPPAHPSLARNEACDRLLPRLMAVCASSSADAIDIEGLGHDLFGAVCKKAPVERGAPAWMARARDRLRDHDATSVLDVARSVGVHPVHLTRVFRAVQGCTPGEYQRGWRLQRATALLDDTRLSIAEVAVRAGFSDQSHLTRQFRAVFGVGPAGYRRLTA